MNTARSHAQAVWRTPEPSFEALEGAILAYHEEATADLQSEHAREIRRLNAALDFMRLQVDGSDRIIRTNLAEIERKSAEIARLNEQAQILTDYLSEAKRQKEEAVQQGSVLEATELRGTIRALEDIRDMRAALAKRAGQLAASPRK